MRIKRMNIKHEEHLEGIRSMALVLWQDKIDLQRKIDHLQAVVDKLPKCWRLTEAGELVQDVPVVPEMDVWCWCREGPDGPHRVTTPWTVVTVGRGLVSIHKNQTSKRVVARWLYSTREAAEAAKGGNS